MPDPDSTLAARLLRIRGRVQGVSYRASAQREAQRLGLSGWVRNRHDGSVEALVCGPADTVERFIAWAHVGPPAASVSAVEVGDAAPTDGAGFDCLPTC